MLGCACVGRSRTVKRLGFIVLALIALAWPLSRVGATPLRPQYGPAEGCGGGKGQVSTGDGDEPYITQAAPPASNPRDAEPAINVPVARGRSVLVHPDPETGSVDRARDLLWQLIASATSKVSGWRSW